MLKTIEQPRIQIATVEILVLKIGSKQMTQAVFNQLETGALIDPNTGLLAGVPWGWINYKRDTEQQKQFVWVRDGKLCRSLIDKRGPSIPHEDGNGHDYSQKLYKLVERGRALSARVATQLLLAGEIVTKDEWHKSAEFWADGWCWNSDLPSANTSTARRWEYAPFEATDDSPPSVALIALYAARANAPGKLASIMEQPIKEWHSPADKAVAVERHQKEVQRVEQWIEGLISRYRKPEELPGLRHEIGATTAAIETLLANWSESLRQLEECNQLFIAV